MIITKKALPRRTVLRGLGTAMALPLLDSMVPAFTALAQTEARPKPRLGVVYVHTGKPGDAINYLLVAHRLAPWAPRINYYLGEAYRLSGKEALARLHLKKTYHWDASEDWRKRARISLSLLSLPISLSY